LHDAPLVWLGHSEGESLFVLGLPGDTLP